MLWSILIACILIAVTVTVHASGVSLLLRSLMKSRATPPTQSWSLVWLLVKVTWLLILSHVAEITVWALFFLWGGCLPNAESAFYFSGISYTTVGYGDVVLGKPWRMLGPLEGLTGILMCGWSASLFFAVISKIYALRTDAKRNDLEP